ncbi:hypothetical protein SELMODRAFT_406324 [Selaginella moellendorffii]|uniref:Uncharacterized protein n=1 Tax=Selaginella moellendorffii TaxID=88036 RepID=D8R204_SELML|nr:hypothetical protein SELMODRAFT_406324 [Selaginella moellendorffii]
MGKWGAFDRDEGRCGIFECVTESSLVLHIQLFGFSRLVHIAGRVQVLLYKPPLEPWAVLRVRTGLPFDMELRYDEEHFDYGMRLENHTELWRPHSSLPLGPSGSRFVGLCSSNGLVCGMLMEHTDWMTFAVGNPITNVWKTLPPAPLDPADRLQPALDRLQPAYLDIGMETDAVSNSYQLAILYQKIHDDDDKIFSLHSVQGSQSEAGRGHRLHLGLPQEGKPWGVASCCIRLCSVQVKLRGFMPTLANLALSKANRDLSVYTLG